MMVRAKFKVTMTEQFENGCTAVHMTAVHGRDNASWSKWTPSGTLSISITNPDAVSALRLGEHYFLDFSPAPPTEAAETA